VLATNAWLSQIPELARAVVPLSSDIVATAPMPERLERSGWTGGEAISNSRLMVHYYRTTTDGRVAFGRGGGGIGFRGHFAFDRAPRRAAEVEADLRRLVPAADGIPVTDTWGGAVDRSEDGLPFFGSLRGRTPIHYGAGYSGNGVAPSLVGGRVLASMALGRDDEWAGCGLVRGVPGRFPPEPVRFLGGSLVKGAVAHKERREDREKGVDPVTRGLARLAPSGFFKISQDGR
jgi:glycine/D-amino acid oxidase-like deaminating enzyme